MTDFKGDVVVRLDTNETVAFKDWKHSFKIGDKSVQSSMEFVPSRPIAMKTKDFVYATSGSATWAFAKDSSDSKKSITCTTPISQRVSIRSSTRDVRHFKKSPRTAWKYSLGATICNRP